MSSQYVEFIAFVTLSMLFTMLTTIWSTVKIREMQSSRKRNHSEQIKAMWRVEDAHFNPKMDSHYMVRPDQDSSIGGMNFTS